MRKTVTSTLLSAIGIALAGAGYVQAVSPQPQPAGRGPSRTSPQRALLDRYCVTCHNERLRTAGLTLDTMDIDGAHVSEGAEVWERVVRKLRAGAMPPAGRPRPDRASYDAFATWLETALDRAAAAKPNPGRPALHRLNRAEYTNAIRDLLAMEVDGRSMLPADNSGYGFDNIGDVLSVSPGLLERYMSAAAKISRLAIGDSTIRPVVETYRVLPNLVQDDRMHEALPFGSRGGMAIRHYFPLDGEYVLKIQLQRTWRGAIRGLTEPHEIDVRLDGARIRLFTIGGEHTETPSFDTPGSYASEYERTADAGLEVRLPVKAGTRVLGVTFVTRTWAAEGMLRPQLPLTSWSFQTCGSAWLTPQCEEPTLDSVQITGPYAASAPVDTASRRKIFVCRPTGPTNEEACATTILSTLARRAYRRPLTDRDVQALLRSYRAGRGQGDFETGIELALRRILVSPHFLFRIERDPANLAPANAYRLGGLELASRLSFFLWSSIPDDELLQVAEDGTLHDRAVLEQQVRRMLADPRAKALVTNFSGQWLHVRNMQTVAPDSKTFPEFDDNLREAFQRETELFLESQLREDRSLLDLLTANYTFVNERLARHYQMPNIYGSHFRRVTFSDGHRGGLLGQGSILTVTSHTTRTAPTIRGKWLLDNFLGSPPPPPPPNVPSLQDNDEGGGKKLLSVRERLEQHRKNPVCASCHASMDPLGFALENFDGIGRWRDSETGTPIDPSGALPDGTKFQGPGELRQLLLGRREQFVTAVTEKLLTYALGRGLEYYDPPAVRQITRAAAPDYRWSSIILGIVTSTPFQMRMAREPDLNESPK